MEDLTLSANLKTSWHVKSDLGEPTGNIDGRIGSLKKISLAANELWVFGKLRRKFDFLQ